MSRYAPHVLKPSVVVTIPVLSGGTAETTWSSPNTVADVPEPGYLVITHAETQDVVQRFGPTQWRRCSVRDVYGYEERCFVNTAWVADDRVDRQMQERCNG